MRFSVRDLFTLTTGVCLIGISIRCLATTHGFDDEVWMDRLKFFGYYGFGVPGGCLVFGSFVKATIRWIENG